MSVMLTVSDYENYAKVHLPKKVLDYYQSGANEQFTLTENRTAFARIRIRPRFLTRDLSSCSTKTTVLGLPVSSPIAVAPTAMQCMAHSDGESATVKACEQMGNVYILSTIATTSIEQVAQVAPNAIKWFQLYVHKDRSLTASLVQRAEAAGFKALVLTVDTPALGSRLADRVNQFELPEHLQLANLNRSLDQQIKQTRISMETSESALQTYSREQFDRTLTWECVDWLRSITTLPIVIKGILTAEDAILAVQHLASAIIVSNHGARQLDYVPATIDALPEVIEAVRDQCEVYLDGGVQTGTDIFKALAIGARAVFLGRPILWGLAHSGEKGVKHVLQLLKDELNDTLLLSGSGSVTNIDRTYVRTIDEYRFIMQRFLNEK